MHIAIALVGRFHNLILHFPIALMVAVAFVEVALRKRIPHDSRRAVVNALLVLTSIAAVLAVITGLAYASDEGFKGEALFKVERHRNIALVATLLIIAATVIRVRGMKIALPAVVVAALAVAFAGHAGGTVVHGEDYYSEPWADPNTKTDDDDGPAVASDGDEVEAKARERFPEGKVPDKPDYVKDIKPIIDRSCTKCHGPEKRKSGLRLDKKRFAMKGGETGPAVVPGDVEKSLMAKYIQLPQDDDDVMPSKGKLLAQSEIDTIKKWIAAGAEWPDDPQ